VWDLVGNHAVVEELPDGLHLSKLYLPEVFSLWHLPSGFGPQRRERELAVLEIDG
jgi:hypothetical protein